MVGNVKSPRPAHLPIPTLHKGHLGHIKPAFQATQKQNKTLFPHRYGSKQKENEMLLSAPDSDLMISMQNSAREFLRHDFILNNRFYRYTMSPF